MRKMRGSELSEIDFGRPKTNESEANIYYTLFELEIGKARTSVAKTLAPFCGSSCYRLLNTNESFRQPYRAIWPTKFNFVMNSMKTRSASDPHVLLLLFHIWTNLIVLMLSVITK
jgi:hypothetical protein